MSNNQKSSFRDKALSLKAGGVIKQFTVEVDGEEFTLEVRRPTMALRAEVTKLMGEHDGDSLAQMFLPISRTVYEPGQPKPVFDVSDLDAMRETGAAEWFDDAMEHAMSALFPKFQKAGS